MCAELRALPSPRLQRRACKPHDLETSEFRAEATAVITLDAGPKTGHVQEDHFQVGYTTARRR